MAVKFQIVRIAKDEPERLVRRETGEPFTYVLGKVAQERAQQFNDEERAKGSGVRFKVKKILETEGQVDWRQREQNRVNSGEYKLLPFDSSHWFWRYYTFNFEGNTNYNHWSRPWLTHFPHYDPVDPEKVCFLESEERAVEDRQTSMGIGRYLTKYYVGKTVRAEHVAGLVGQALAEYDELKIATTEEDILSVYLNGPVSCMAHSPERYKSPKHPCMAYADSDLAVAYIERRGEAVAVASARECGCDACQARVLGGQERNIVARAIVWPSKKKFGRLYGDSARLIALLNKEGYFPMDRPSGAKIRALEFPLAPNHPSKRKSAFIFPYVDYIETGKLTEDKQWIILGGGDMKTNESYHNGGMVWGMATCDRCGKETWHIEPSPFAAHESVRRTVRTGDRPYWCHECSRNNHVQCTQCGYAYVPEVPMTMTKFYSGGDQPVCPDCTTQYMLPCAECGDMVFSATDMGEVLRYYTLKDEPVCRACGSYYKLVGYQAVRIADQPVAPAQEGVST